MAMPNNDRARPGPPFSVSWGSHPGQPLRRPLQKVSAGATNEDLAIDPLNAGELWAVEGVTVRDATSAATRIEFLAGRYGVERPIGALGALVANVPQRFTDGFYLSDSERLIVRFVGTTSGDALLAVIEGEVRYLMPPEVPVEVSG